MVATASVRSFAASAASAPDQPVGARIDVQHVSHRFALRGAALDVLDDVSVSVEPGEFVALLGPSGCGKSTLLRLVAGLDRPAEGTLLADGEPIAGPDPSRVVVFQDPTLFPWRTVRANVGLGPQAQRHAAKRSRKGAAPDPRDVDARIDAALELVGLTEFADAFPHQLSGGMAQRAALARALVNDPALLVLDEPFGKLDSLTRIRMQSELVALWQRARFSVLLVTHDVEEALFVANRVIVFSGRPARVVAEVRNDAPYPRHRDDPKLVALRRQVLAQLGLDA
ncbi:ABC transporter ATP-binding protein [Paraburkholderia caballeronis]|uniref:NitT/TauT family transport system ATP-binding protein n=1 Tax=Paraburkholderia caballeronis TaxID=416943 RepID=A0A1H7P4L9_9BURK|nr:ABC transporter ATP-binding protein [Paraburkholderia caballeronis]PXW25397.1 NitT/TauT family transport system ATP-binding protein [Paraburkholderia caballeronis]PXX01004.1 NitT/TauT family transport system ATP-binding protein [Paraburkholderia caballeronis]RAJ99643.1 NitT/TauT family transport system ATP-binding protein [Paraburkholderia caballeronis]TDV11378.1 NitT/TauT family transport system ATP-binding protein [Paraburkholderia caballeronis]TDV14568.1 NitT/TauT family transport system